MSLSSGKLSTSMDIRKLLAPTRLLLFAVLVSLLGSDAVKADHGCPFGHSVRSRFLELGSATFRARTPQFEEAVNCLRQQKALEEDFYRTRWWDVNSRQIDPRCEHVTKDPFRTISGMCNNLYEAEWGTAMSTFRRLLPSAYDDNKEIPRIRGVRGWLLPSARKVSTACHPPADKSNENPELSLLVMSWGQFMDHDITGTPESELEAGQKCCPDMGADGFHPHISAGKPCFPIPIPEHDVHFRKNCLEFLRSMPERDVPKQGEKREQINALTSYIDASMVYGSSQNESDALRTHQMGLLRTSGDRCESLPESTRFFCVVTGDKSPCFQAGDQRVNEVPFLTALHLVFVRNHNRLARTLRFYNSHWDDELLFQAARKINIAILQQILYYEWLPTVLGQRGMALARLNRPYKYDSHLDPTVLNEFATVAFRCGHSLLPSTFMTAKSDDENLEDTFFRTGYLGNCTDGVNTMVRGLLERHIHKVDPRVTKAVRDKLFFNVSGTGESSDLVARNTQRGRDHGLPSYMTFVREYGWLYWMWRGHRASFPPECLRAYELFPEDRAAIEDVDLFTGFLHEPVYDGILPFAFNYVIGRQMHMLRDGDRFWFETDDPVTRFTPDQLREIKKMTMSRLLCDNTGIGFLQRHAFYSLSRENPKVNCDTLPSMNMEVFKQPPFQQPETRSY